METIEEGIYEVTVNAHYPGEENTGIDIPAVEGK
jgi:hypothetical protein